MIEALQPPRPTGLIREARLVLEFPLLVLRSVELARQPRGHGEPVLVLPGYGAGDGNSGGDKPAAPFVHVTLRTDSFVIIYRHHLLAKEGAGGG